MNYVLKLPYFYKKSKILCLEVIEKGHQGCNHDDNDLNQNLLKAKVR